MKAQVKLPHVTIEVEGENAKDLFAQLGKVSEVFGEDKCGLCQSPARFGYRQAGSGKQTFSFYEMVCTSPKCRAKLSFGQSSDGESLFPIRRLDEKGKPDWEKGASKDNGWTKYKGEAKD